MKISKIILTAAAAVLFSGITAAAEEKEPAILPDATYMFARRDTCDLYLDVYEPERDRASMTDGRSKPTIIFLFGGGFIEGTRNDPFYTPWYKDMVENGYRIIAVDYRLGLKGSTKVGIAQVNALDKAIHMAVEDLFSATAYIVENAESFGVDPENIVISGSSAGAITVLQAEYEICNGTEYTATLPEGFRYSGVMSFAGGILSRKGKLKYENEPAPTLMLHGTGDKLVNYSQIRFFNLGFFGSHKISERFRKFGYNYNVLRYLEHGHEIANIMEDTVPEQIRFLERNVMAGTKCIIDMTIDDPAIERGSGSQSRKELYGD